MILKNRSIDNKQLAIGNRRSAMSSILLFACCTLLIACFSFSTCKYGFKDTNPPPPEVKTFRVNFFENKAQYVSTQLGIQLTEKLKQKIIGTTRLQQTNKDDAHYDISGYVSQYYTSTTGISNNNATVNRLSVGFHLIFKNTLDDTKSAEHDISRNFDFSASQTLPQVEASLTPEIVKGIVDEIFNKIFSNW